MRMKNRIKVILFKITLCFLMILSSCSSIDCPLSNHVYSIYKLAGDVPILRDTLTISTTRSEGTDSVYINLKANVDSLLLPLSYQAAEDVWYFEIKTKNGTTTLDTVKIRKTNSPHFESIDCKPSFFHTITGVESTHHRIDSIIILTPNVTYDNSKPHFYIYFKDTDNSPIATY